MKKTLLLLFTLLIASSASAQPPTWTKTLPKAGNSTYMYCCEFAVDSSIDRAREKAIARVLETTAYRLGQPVESGDVIEAIQHGTDMKVISRQFNIPINIVCPNYFETLPNGTYRVYILCQVAVAGNVEPRFEVFNGCEDRREYRNDIALVKSIFIPGLGQMGKRHYGEGALTLTSELLLAGAGTACYFGARNELNKMRTGELDYNGFMNARKAYDSYRIASYVVWGTAAGLYIFNLCRAYTLTPKYKDTFAVYPAVLPTTHDYAYGIGITLNLR